MGFPFTIRRVSISEYYHAENGDHVTLYVLPDDTARLSICRPVNNKLYFTGEYKSRRAALIAMHKRCGKCEFKSMTQNYERG